MAGINTIPEGFKPATTADEMLIPEYDKQKSEDKKGFTDRLKAAVTALQG